MPENYSRFTIREVPNDVLSQLDEIAKEKSLSRNQLIVDILTNYVAVQDRYFAQLLPVVTQTLLKAELSALTETSSTCIRSIALSLSKLITSVSLLDELLYDADDYKSRTDKFVSDELEKLKISTGELEKISSAFAEGED